MDLVTVAQAFHWFDGPAALAEIHRVLQAGRPARRSCGTAAWRTSRSTARSRTLIEPYRMGTPTHRGDAWRAAFEGTTLFGPLEEHVFANEQVLDADGLAARDPLDQLHRAAARGRSGRRCSRAPAS